MLKSYGVVGWVGGQCDFSVSPSPFGLDFCTYFGLGLDNFRGDLKKLFFRGGGVIAMSCRGFF